MNWIELYKDDRPLLGWLCISNQRRMNKKNGFKLLWKFIRSMYIYVSKHFILQLSSLHFHHLGLGKHTCRRWLQKKKTKRNSHLLRKFFFIISSTCSNLFASSSTGMVKLAKLYFCNKTRKCPETFIISCTNTHLIYLLKW